MNRVYDCPFLRSGARLRPRGFRTRLVPGEETSVTGRRSRQAAIGHLGAPPAGVLRRNARLETIMQYKPGAGAASWAQINQVPGDAST